MRCPYCNHNEDKVIDSRETMDAVAVRRRRECINCGRRFTTYEYIEKMPIMVIKKDGRREPFSREKVISGLLKSCQKRPVSMDSLERLVSEVEGEVQKKFDREVESRHIGEMVIQRLVQLDDVAYVRFASVYRQFKDVNQFVKESRDILSKKGK
ncbi:MAG: transcriptional regulator NrdR [Candidatus Omnitrophota bacterium]